MIEAMKETESLKQKQNTLRNQLKTLETNVNNRIDGIDTRIDAIDGKLDRVLDTLTASSRGQSGTGILPAPAQTRP